MYNIKYTIRLLKEYLGGKSPEFQKKECVKGCQELAVLSILSPSLWSFPSLVPPQEGPLWCASTFCWISVPPILKFTVMSPEAKSLGLSGYSLLTSLVEPLSVYPPEAAREESSATQELRPRKSSPVKQVSQFVSRS